MPHYLVQLSYTPEAWAAQVRNPQDRVELVRPFFEQLGGRFESVYFAFGEYDVVGILEFPDNVSVAAATLLVNSGGAVKAIRTTPLMSIDEGIRAMRKAHEIGETYRPPTAGAGT
jgi:uncharacterized protein with GYD domain